jgi:hypothetical protein
MFDKIASYAQKILSPTGLIEFPVVMIHKKNPTIMLLDFFLFSMLPSSPSYRVSFFPPRRSWSSAPWWPQLHRSPWPDVLPVGQIWPPNKLDPQVRDEVGTNYYFHLHATLFSYESRFSGASPMKHYLLSYFA